MNLPDFLTRHPYNEIRLTGHRIGLEHVIQLYQEGLSPELVVEHYPSLPLLLVRKVIEFYEANKSDVDVYVAACEAEVARQRAALLKRRRSKNFGTGWTRSDSRKRLDADALGISPRRAFAQRAALDSNPVA